MLGLTLLLRIPELVNIYLCNGPAALRIILIFRLIQYRYKSDGVISNKCWRAMFSTKKQQRRERYAALSPNKKEESQAKKREYQCSHLTHLKDEAGASKLEQARAKNREYQRSHLARLKAEADASKLEEARTKNREDQRRCRAHLKAEAISSKLDASSESTPIHDLNLEIDEIDTRIDDKGNSCQRNHKGNSCKRKWDMASQVDNIGILLRFLLSTFGFCSLNCWHCIF